ncbi:MAG TPA: RHS repeat-associated core domain-containing protein, partial [Chlamydiales bacterium]|nr:RHS repeat-associated core domain-containing protein [Chlamydiales bacterium]
TAHQYDRAGNILANIRWIQSNNLQISERFEYDSQKRLISKTDPAGHRETIDYNDHHINQHNQKVLQKTHTDSMELQTIETFDTRGNIVKIEQKKNGKTLALQEKFTNARGLPTLQINTVFTPTETSHTIRTRWEYDALGRPIKLIEAAETTEEKVTITTYTSRGEKQTITKPDGTILTFLYTPLGYLQTLLSSDRTVNHQMRYNKLGHLIWHDGIERITDPRGRLLEEKFLEYTIQNRYNNMGQRITCSCKEANFLIEYTYRNRDMTEVTRKTFSNLPLYTHQYLTRDLSGNLLHSLLPANRGQIQYKYDSNSRRTQISAPAYSQQIVNQDAAGNILTLLTQDQQATFTYDDLYQLTSENGPFNHTYINDSLFSRHQKDDETFTINSLNQVTSHIVYDKNGNPQSQQDHTYTFDALNRLIQIQTPTFSQTYTYDSQHRRISATTWVDAVPTTLYFLYDGQNEIGSLDETNEVINLRILGNAPHAEIDATIAIELQGEPYAPIHDLCGNIAALIPLLRDASPKIAFYSAFGEEINPLASPWRFSSKRVDPTGLVYYGRRYYQPDFGRWLSPDPAGFTNGINLYAFVGNCPLTHFDEYGLVTTSFNSHWQNPEPWKNWEPTSWQQRSWQGMSDRLRTKPPILIGPAYSAIPKPWKALRADPDATPIYYRNGIFNSAKESVQGALTLQKT